MSDRLQLVWSTVETSNSDAIDGACLVRMSVSVANTELGKADIETCKVSMELIDQLECVIDGKSRAPCRDLGKFFDWLATIAYRK
jgi:hypothetical protein